MKILFTILCIFILLLFPLTTSAQNPDSIDLGEDSNGQSLEEVTTKKFNTKNETPNTSGTKAVNNINSANEQTLQTADSRNIFQKIGDFIVNAAERTFPFINPQEKIEESKQSSLTDKLKDAFIGSVFPPFSVGKLALDIFNPKKPFLPKLNEVQKEIYTDKFAIQKEFERHVSEAAYNVSDFLTLSTSSGHFSKFNDPYDEKIPRQVRDIYEYSSTWDPELHPENYVQCTTFVYMAYSLTNKWLPKHLGNAKDWDSRTDVFEVYTSGVSSEPIQTGDVMVWEDGDFGHVGVVVKIDNENSSFDVSNANSTQVVYRFYWRSKEEKTLILDSDGKQVKWRPDHWLRVRNYLEDWKYFTGMIEQRNLLGYNVKYQ